MASKKNLKKDINYLTDEVIGTCLMHEQMQSAKNQEEIDGLIEEMLLFREELIEKLNNPPTGENKKSLKDYYRTLYGELLEKVNDTFGKLNAITE